MKESGSVYYTLSSEHAGYEEYGYKQTWYASDEKYNARTRTYTAQFNLKPGFVDSDGMIAFRLKCVFSSEFKKSVSGTTWWDIV